MLFPPETIDTSIVCPVCWKWHCKLFRKLQDLKFLSEERRIFLTTHHKPVCARCKRQRCRPFKVKPAGIIYCFAKPRKKLGKKKRLPDWWDGFCKACGASDQPRIGQGRCPQCIPLSSEQEKNWWKTST